MFIEDDVNGGPSGAPAANAAPQEKIYDLDEIPFDDEPAAPSGNPENKPAPATTAPAAADAAGAPDPNAPAKTGFDLFLESQGIVGGKLQYGDTEAEFSKLSPEEQLEVLNQLVQDKPAAPSLDGDLKHIDDLLKAGKSLKDIAKDILGTEAGAPVELSLDDINRMDIKAQYPEFDEEDIEVELEERRNSKLYEKKSEAMRGKYAPQPADVDLAAQAAAAKAAIEADNAAQAEAILSTVSTLTEVDGFQLNDEQKNYVLGSLLEVDESGDSEFVRLQDDPKEQFKMAYYYKMMPTITTYFQNEIAAAYERGKAEVVGGFPTKPVATAQTGGTNATRTNAQKVDGNTNDNLMQVSELG